MKVAGAILATALALALQTTVARVFTRVGGAIDLVLVVVVYIALTSGPVAGMLTGTFAGLVQDAMSTGVIGIGGLAKTIVGFITGVIGTQFIVVHSLPRFVVFFAATILHAVVFIGLYVLLDLRQFSPAYGAVAGRALGNAVIGIVAFEVMERLPGSDGRRRMRGRV